MARLLHKPERSKANKRQNRSNNKIGCPEKCEGANIISGLDFDSTPDQVHEQPIQENRQDAEIVEERFQVGMDNRNR